MFEYYFTRVEIEYRNRKDMWKESENRTTIKCTNRRTIRKSATMRMDPAKTKVSKFGEQIEYIEVDNETSDEEYESSCDTSSDKYEKRGYQGWHGLINNGVSRFGRNKRSDKNGDTEKRMKRRRIVSMKDFVLFKNGMQVNKKRASPKGSDVGGSGYGLTDVEKFQR